MICLVWHIVILETFAVVKNLCLKKMQKFNLNKFLLQRIFIIEPLETANNRLQQKSNGQKLVTRKFPDLWYKCWGNYFPLRLVHVQQALSLPSPHLYYIRQSAMLQKRSWITVHRGVTVVQELTNQIGQVSLWSILARRPWGHFDGSALLSWWAKTFRRLERTLFNGSLFDRAILTVPAGQVDG